MPEFWVLNLNGITQERLDELAEIDVQDIRDIPDSFQLTPIQDRIRTSVKKQTQYISDELEKELTDVIYPIHFLDFETASSAIPRYANTRPYQAVPFQWSNHILNEDGTLQHHAYLCREDKDPREEFTVTLLEELAKEGTIFIYTTYEKTIIGQLAQHLPQYHDQLNETLSRFKDLCDIIRKHYYHAKFHGSFSLKFVLPALLPHLSYNNLIIQEGNQASLEYLRMIDPATAPAEKKKIRKNLLDYCGHDTLAMVKIREQLLNTRA
jgi:predicted RecB family nuclease